MSHIQCWNTRLIGKDHVIRIENKNICTFDISLHYTMIIDIMRIVLFAKKPLQRVAGDLPDTCNQMILNHS